MFDTQAINNKSYGDIVRLVMSLAAVEIYIIVLCLVGGEVSTQFDLMFYSMNEISWSEFPLEAQKLLLMMITIAQKPIYIEGYMNTQCTREMLKKVVLH